jgi:hypothetical protein
VTSQPQPGPGEYLRPLRDLAAWALVGAPAVLLFVAIIRLIPAGDGFGDRAQDSFYAFVNVPTTFFPLAAVVLALLVRPAHPKARLITLIAAVEYAVAAFFAVVFGILVGLIQIAGFSVRTAFEELLVRVAWLAVFALAGFAVYRIWRGMFHVPKPVAQPGVYGQPQYGMPGAYPGQPGYGPPPGYPGQPQPGQSQPGQSQPGQAQPGQSQPGQSQPGQSQPGQSQPGQPQPGQAPPGPGQPVWNQPAFGQPPGGGWGPPPAATQPVPPPDATQPVSAQPYSAQPFSGPPAGAPPFGAPPPGAQPFGAASAGAPSPGAPSPGAQPFGAASAGAPSPGAQPFGAASAGAQPAGAPPAGAQPAATQPVPGASDALNDPTQVVPRLGSTEADRTEVVRDDRPGYRPNGDDQPRR